LKNYNDTKPSNNKDFEIMYNALSIGWHLRKIMELNPNIVEDERLILWLIRHKILKQVKRK